MFAGFEMRVGEAEEEQAEGGAGEEVGEEFHGVGAEGGDVVVCRWGGVRGRGVGGGGRGWSVLGAEGVDAVGDVGGYLGADFEAY